MKKTMLVMCLVGMSAVHAITTEPIDGGGTALVVDAAAFSPDEVAALNGNTVQELWKTGSSTLEAAGIGSFTGAIRVKGGIYKPTADDGLGAASCVTYVTQGGCLYASAGADRTVHIAGTGYGDYPAVVKCGGQFDFVMDDDATMGFDSHWRSVGKTLDMNGKTITFKFAPGASRSEGVWPSSSNVLNPGHIVIDSIDAAGKNEGRLTFLYNSDQMQGSDHTLTVRHGRIDWYFARRRTNWKLILEKSDSIGYGGMHDLGAGNCFSWDGPIEIAAGMTLTLNPSLYSPVVVRGDISGAGSVAKGGPTEGVSPLYKTTAAMLAGRNSYTGGTIVPLGTLVLAGPDSVASTDAAKWTVSPDAAVALRMNGGAVSDGFDETDALAALESFKTWGANRSLLLAATNGAAVQLSYAKGAGTSLAMGAYTNAAFGLAGDVRIETAVSGGAALSLYGNAKTTLSAPAGTAHDAGAIYVFGGETVMTNFGRVCNKAYNIEVGEYGPDEGRNARLVLESGTRIDQGWDGTPGFLLVGHQNTHGAIEIRDGAAITNYLNNLGQSDKGYGAIYQTGGFSYWGKATGAYDAYYGTYGGGSYVDVSGGMMKTWQWIHMASHSFHSTALIEISGSGEFNAGSPELQIGWTGTGVVYQTGGRLTTGTGGYWLRINSNNYCQDGNGFGLLAVADAGVATVANNGILMAERTNGVAHLAIVDGGQLEAKVVCRATKGGGNNSSKTMPFPELCGEGRAYPSFVHFNGGVLRALADGYLLGGRSSEQDTRPTDVLVYGKGAILDSSNFTVNVDAPLKAPTGNGVASVELPAGAVRTGYLGAPLVGIYGDGEGATAAAIFDKETGTISGIRVLTPGRNYTTATARLMAGGKKSITNILACTLAPSASGGLVKRGTGTLVLNAANSYGGRTTLEGGVLKLGAEDAIPSGSAIELAGGALDANGFAAPTEWHLDFAKVLASGAPISCPGSLDFPAGSTLTVENIDYDYLASRDTGFPILVATGAVSGSPALLGLNSNLWKLAWHGNALYASSTRGTAVILR